MEKSTSSELLYLTAEQCALRYNISLRQFQILVKRGDIPQPISIGSSKRWSIRVLEDFESEQINRQSVFFSTGITSVSEKEKIVVVFFVLSR